MLLGACLIVPGASGLRGSGQLLIQVSRDGCPVFVATTLPQFFWSECPAAEMIPPPLNESGECFPVNWRSTASSGLIRWAPL